MLADVSLQHTNSSAGFDTHRKSAHERCCYNTSILCLPLHCLTESVGKCFDIKFEYFSVCDQS